MNEKIIKVFYGSDLLPYKDKERTVHFPITGSAFLGASNTTKIRFYFDQIGDHNTTWVSVAKLPNGKQGSKVLSIASDDSGNYAELELSNWYTQAKGDVFIALQGYQGGVEYSYDSETELYEIHGTPTVQTTGSIKLGINYAPIGQVADYNDEFTTYQEILSALGDKANAIGELPHFNVNGTDSVLSFAQAHNKEAIVIKYLNTNFIGSFNITFGNYALFELESMYGNIRYSTNEFDAIDLTNLTFADIFSNTYMHNHELVENKVTSITSSSTNTQYPRAKAVYDLAQTKQDTLHSGTTIKTINGESVLGSGNIVVGGGSGSSAWGQITGDIADQTDLQNEFQNVREVAEGKTSSYVISYDAPVIIEETFIPNTYTRKDGSLIATYNDFLSYVGEYNTSCNNDFENDTKYPIDIAYKYFVTIDNEVITTRDMREGDIILVVELDVPDRWFSKALSGYAYPLETSKIDLNNYYTKSQTDTEDNKVAHDIAVEYNENTLYGVGDLCIHDKLLYKCNTANTTGTWDSTKWDLTTVNSELGIIKGNYVTTDTAQTITGEKTFQSNKIILRDETVEMRGSSKLAGYNGNLLTGEIYPNLQYGGWTVNKDIRLMNNSNILPNITSYNCNLGSPTNLMNNLYLKGFISDGTYKTSPAQINNNFAPAYDSTATYSVGDIVMYEGGLYQCNTAITTAEAWDSTHWTAISVNSGFAKKDEAFPTIKAPVPTSLTDYELSLLLKGCKIDGEFLGLKDPFVLPSGVVGSTPNNRYAILFGHTNNAYTTECSVANIDTVNKKATLTGGGQANYLIFNFGMITFKGGVNLGQANSSVSIKGKSFPNQPSNIGTFVNKMINGTWSWENEIPTSVSLTDGGTISDTTLQGLIARHQPIVLNGFTCYFSCDDGTNYQYISTRYDATANKNHINVITINKTTWVATFHTSDLAV